MEQTTQYEYEFPVGPATWKVSLKNGMFAFKGGFMSKEIQQNQITGIGIGTIFNEMKEIDQTIDVSKVETHIAQLLVAYQTPEMKKKLIRVNIAPQNTICQKMIKDLLEKHKKLYVGAGPLSKVTTALGISQKWVYITIVVIIMGVLAATGAYAFLAER